MRKNLFKTLSLSALLLANVSFFASCDKDDEDPKTEDEKPSTEPEKVVKRVYFLNEGSLKANNSTLDMYYPNGESAYGSKIFTAANGEGIGDTGQDIIAYGGRLYISVYGSKYFAKLDSNGKLIEKYSFTAEEGEPRQIVAKDGFVYVTLYSGQVAKFDTTSISAPKALVKTNAVRPEGIAVSGDNLLVVNAGDYNVAYDNKLTVIDIKTFSFKENIEIEQDPTSVVALDNNAYVIYYNTTTWAQNLLVVDLASKKYSDFAENIAKVVTDGKNLFLVESVTDWSTYTTSNKFYKCSGSEKSEFFDLKETSELSSTNVYLFEIDPENGDFYIGTTDYTTNGNIYRFDKDGKFITKFETSSVNPNHAAFIY